MQAALRFILIGSTSLLLTNTALADGPSFDCSKADSGSIEALVCQNAELSALDRQLASVYAVASNKAINEQPPVLKAEQRGWIKGRDKCWKSADPSSCVKLSYQQRTAELQARYQLIPGNGPFSFGCNGDPLNEVIVTFYPTDPATLIAERGDSMALMYQVRSASGAKYEGQNEMFWEHQSQAIIRWGYAAPEMSCRKNL